MLLQSQGGEILLLPALPGAWPNGSIKGLCARGGFQVDITWRKGALFSAVITSKHGGSIPVCYAGRVLNLNLHPGEAAHLRPVPLPHRTLTSGRARMARLASYFGKTMDFGGSSSMGSTPADYRWQASQETATTGTRISWLPPREKLQLCSQALIAVRRDRRSRILGTTSRHWRVVSRDAVSGSAYNSLISLKAGVVVQFYARYVCLMQSSF